MQKKLYRTKVRVETSDAAEIQQRHEEPRPKKALTSERTLFVTEAVSQALVLELIELAARS